MNNKDRAMIEEMDSILKFNQGKETVVNSLKHYLESEEMSVDFETVTGSDNLSIGYEIAIVFNNCKFIMTNKPDERSFTVKMGYNCGGKEVRLYYALLGFILETKNKIKFNLDLLQGYLDNPIG
jgi:hypothetical protein